MIIVDDKKIRIERLVLGPYETNAYMLTCRRTGQSLAVDAPAAASRIIASLKDTSPRYILLTHDHYDHTGVIVSLRARLKVPLAAHREDSRQLKTPPEIYLEDGGILKLGEVTVEARHTPGHTPGSTCFLAGKYLFAGDTIFPGGPGHTETPEEFRQIIYSITRRIFTLPDETVLLPGHGEGTTVGQARAGYAAFAGRKHAPDLCGDVTWAGY